MCIGIPMQVIEQRDLMALCRGRGREEMVNTMLIGPQEPGTWVLNFIGSAREVLTEEEARQTNDALDALTQIMSGEGEVDVDAYFSDLTDPERLPGSFKPGEG